MFHEIMDAVAKDLKVVAKESGSFHYKGLRVSTVFPSGKTDLFEIVIDGDEYMDSAIPMLLRSGLSDNDYLSPVDATNYGSVVGFLGYMASAFRPDLELEASLLGRTFMTPTLRNARKANSILAWAKENRYPMRYRRGVACLTVFSDSAGPNEQGTQSGRIFALTSEDSHRVHSGVKMAVLVLMKGTEISPTVGPI